MIAELDERMFFRALREPGGPLPDEKIIQALDFMDELRGQYRGSTIDAWLTSRATVGKALAA